MGLRKAVVSFLKRVLSRRHVAKLKVFADRFLPYSKTLYAQYGEDAFLLEYFKQRASGIYVDVGAYHPKQFSNTFALYKRGWTGINIDANPGSMRLFRALRKSDLNIEAAVSDTEDVIEFASWGIHSENSGDAAQIQNLKTHLGGDPEVHRLRTKRLSDILDEVLPAGAAIDVLSVDVEGMDVKVLNSLDWSKHRPEIIIAETFCADVEALMKDQLYKTVHARGYQMVSWYYRSVFFKRI